MNTLTVSHPAGYEALDPGLRTLFERALDRLYNLDGLLAGWHYGSLARGLCDRFSDVDPVFLLDDQAFAGIDSQIPGLFQGVGDRLVQVWPQDYNSPSFKNFGLLLKYHSRLYQFDIFFVCRSRMDEPFCRWHYEGLGRENLIFDRTGQMAALLERPGEGAATAGLTLPGQGSRSVRSLALPDSRLWRESLLPRFVCYLFHLNMSIKYYLRQDLLKFQNVRQRLYAEHAAMLLATTLPQTWGSLEARIHLYLGQADQADLESYFLGNDIHELMANLTCLAGKVAALVREACRQRGETFPQEAWAEVNHALITRLRLVQA